MATLIMRDLSTSNVPHQICAQATQFLLATRREWKTNLGDFFDHWEIDGSILDFLDIENSESAARRILSGICQLRFPFVHWVKINAGAERLENFIALFETSHSDMSEEMLANLAQLILESAAQRLAQQPLNPALRDRLSNVLTRFAGRRWTADYGIHPLFSDYSEWNWWGNPRKKLAKEFSLGFPALDWAAANADPELLPQLLDRYFAGWCTQASLVEQTCLGEIILASLDLGFQTNSLPKEVLGQAARFIREQHGEQAGNLANWAKRGCRPLAIFIADAILLWGDEKLECESGPTPTDSDTRWELFEKLHARFSDGSKKFEDWYFITTYYLTCALRCQFERVDPNISWGKLNANPLRASEFVSFYLPRADRLRCEARQLLDLCEYSLDTAQAQGPLDEETRTCAMAYLHRVYGKNIFEQKDDPHNRWKTPLARILDALRTSCGLTSTRRQRSNNSSKDSC